MENLSKKQLLIMIGIGGVIISIIIYYIYSITSQNSYEQLDEKSELNIVNQAQNVEKLQEDEEEIVVHIAGQVRNPGIIRTKEGARIADIIEKAGGLTEHADISEINLAYIIEDGQKITIPSKEEQNKSEYLSTENGDGIIQETPQNSQTTTKSNVSSTNKTININKATLEELQTLQGIGESTATKIIEYRKQNGDFKQIEDLKNVPRYRRSKI